MIKLPIIFSALILVGCAATGPSFKKTDIQPNSAQLIIYRSANGGPAPIEINGNHICRLPRNGYFVKSVQAGEPVTISSRLFGDPDISKYTFTPKARERRYIRVEVNTASVTAGALGGALGGLIGGTAATAAATREGSFVFREGSETEALQTKEGC